MYPTFAKEAREEGFDKIAILVRKKSLKLEKTHEERYLALLNNIESNRYSNVLKRKRGYAATVVSS